MYLAIIVLHRPEFKMRQNLIQKYLYYLYYFYTDEDLKWDK